MEKIWILAIALLLTMSGCGLKEMNSNIERSNTLIKENADAIEKSTATVYNNAQAVEESTALIEKNKAVMESLLSLIPTMPAKLTILLILCFLFLPTILIIFSIRRFEKKMEYLIKK